MRRARALCVGLLALAAGCGAARAGDKPLIGPAPGWVRSSPPPREAPSATSLPAAVLLNDMQLAFDATGWTDFHDVRIKVQAPEGLQALGAIPFAWSPWSDTLTFHKAAILRGAQVIDVLPRDAGFTVLRREAGLERAMLTGELTAVLQPEGLQVGDVLEIALSIRHADPLLKGRAAALLAAWDVSPIGRVRIEARWPASLPMRTRETAGLPPLARITEGGVTRASVELQDVAAAVAPAQAPARFQHGRQVEFSTFQTWGEVAAVMAPLYERAAQLTPQSPLRAEVARIAAANSDPKARAAAVLQLVETQVRYLAHAEAGGGYTPQTADDTWRLRYGDCKAKTALLLALLKPLGVAAEPVLVNVGGGDAIADHLPSASVFDHVLVRVRLGGRDYWLDGARRGDDTLDPLTTPDYGWGLPLGFNDARLVHIQPAPATQPLSRQVVRYDASKGVTTPAGARFETVFAGDAGLGLRLQFAALTPERLQQALRTYWASAHTAFTPAHMAATWDPARREERLTADGTSKLDWSGAGFEMQTVELGGASDLKRDPAASDSNAPYLIGFPAFDETDESVVLPPGASVPPAALKTVEVDRAIGGLAYRRSATFAGGVFRVVASTRALKPEISAEEARAATDPLTKLGEEGVYAPAGPQKVAADDAAALDTRPTTASAHVSRGAALLDARRFKEAEAEFDAAIALDARLQLAWSDRAMARAWQADPRATADAAVADSLGKPEIVAARARAILAQQTGDPPGALAAFGKALALAPKDAFSLAQRADVEINLRDYDDARRDLDTLAKSGPGGAQMAGFARAYLEAAQNHRDAALREAAALPVATPEARFTRARLYAQLDAKAAAIADLDAVIAIKPSIDAYLLRSSLRGANTPGGEADIAAAEALDPKNLDVLLRRVNLLTAAHDYATALPLLDKVIKANPNVGNLRVGRAEIEMRLGRTADAEADFIAARGSAGLEAANASVLCAGETKAHADPAGALQDCTRAMREAPAAPTFVIDRAIAAQRLGLEAQASADLVAARALAGVDAGQLNNACYALAQADSRLPEAEAFCDAALHLRAGEPQTLDSRAFTLLRMGRNAEAVRAYDEALRTRPKFAMALYGRALAQKRLGHVAESARDRAEAVAIDPRVVATFSDMGVTFPN